MALDLILRGACLSETEGSRDIGIKDGRIVVINPSLAAEGETLLLDGALVTPGLVETHIHLDKSRILDRCTPSPDRGTDHMARVASVKPDFTVEDANASEGSKSASLD